MALFGVCLFQCRYPLTQARALRWSMGLMGSVARRPSPGRAAEHHPRRPKRASFPKASLQLPSMFPLAGGRCLRVLPRASASRRWRAAADRGTARCGRRARKPEQARAIQQPPCTLAPCLVRDRTSKAEGRSPRSTAREGGRSSAPLLPNPTRLRTLT